MKQKSDQDEEEKVAEKVKEEHMSDRSEEMCQSINPSAYRPKIIQREEG